MGTCLAFEFMFAGSIMHHAPHGVIDFHQLVDSGTTAVTELVTSAASSRMIQRRRHVRRHTQGLAVCKAGCIGLLASIAQDPDQPLCQHTDQTG